MRWGWGVSLTDGDVQWSVTTEGVSAKMVVVLHFICIHGGASRWHELEEDTNILYV